MAETAPLDKSQMILVKEWNGSQDALDHRWAGKAVAMAKAQRRASLGSRGDPGREITSSVSPGEGNLDREINEYGDDLFELEDMPPTRPRTANDGGLERKGKDANGAGKDDLLLALETGSDAELQVNMRTAARINALFARCAGPLYPGSRLMRRTQLRHSQ